MPHPTAFADPTLATCDRGSVRRCRCCDRISLTFNETTVSMQRKDLARMRETIDAVCDAAGRPGAVWGWALRTETAGQRVVFELWGDDAEMLSTLLAQAETMLDLDTMLVDAIGPRHDA
ncbi:MAG: hypothetical protein AAGK21_05270 [Bacteroidota bacterium]